jgi:hypothetical protein
MPLWTTSTPQPQRPYSSPPTVSHFCLLSIVPFIIWANVKWLAYSSIYVFKHHSSSVRCDFIDGVLNIGGSSEGDGGGTDNDALPWSNCVMWCICVIKFICIDMYMMYVWYVFPLFWRIPIRGGSKNRGYIKSRYIPLLTEERMTLYSSVNRGIYGHVAEAWGGGPSMFIDYV